MFADKVIEDDQIPFPGDLLLVKIIEMPRAGGFPSAEVRGQTLGNSLWSGVIKPGGG